MRCIFINGIPMNVWPIRNRLHLRDIAEIEEVEYIEINTDDDE